MKLDKKILSGMAMTHPGERTEDDLQRGHVLGYPGLAPVGKRPQQSAVRHVRSEKSRRQRPQGRLPCASVWCATTQRRRQARRSFQEISDKKRTSRREIGYTYETRFRDRKGRRWIVTTPCVRMWLVACYDEGRPGDLSEIFPGKRARREGQRGQEKIHVTRSGRQTGVCDHGFVSACDLRRATTTDQTQFQITF